MKSSQILAPLAFFLLLGACGDRGGQRPAGRSLAFGRRGPDSAEVARATAEKARADSAASFKARFGSRVAKPDSIRALYVNAWAAGSRSRMRELIRIADETEINAFVIDIKESDTYLTHDSTGIALAKEIGADQRPGSKWLPSCSILSGRTASTRLRASWCSRTACSPKNVLTSRSST